MGTLMASSNELLQMAAARLVAQVQVLANHHQLNQNVLQLRVFLHHFMGSATGGAMAPPPDFTRGGGPVMHLAPPDFRKNFVMYTIINVQCLSLKKQWNAYIIVYILLKFSKTSKFFLKTFKIVNKIFEISSIFSIFFSQNTLTFLIYSKCLTFSQKI